MTRWLEEAGIDAFHVTLANHGFIGDTIPAMGTVPHGCFLDLAAAISSVTEKPVTAVGRIVSPKMAKTVVADKVADMVGLGRQLIADPDWPKKVQSGQSAAIRPCIMCNRGCLDNIMHRNYIACNVNPLSGLDEEVLPAASRSSRPALVIGGGIAGMQAAIVLAESGTEVTLMEASDRLGGQLILAATPPGKDELKPFLDYLVRQVESLPITVHLEAAFDHAAMTAHQDKEIFVATGARPAMIPIPGADSPHATTAWSILKGTTPVAETAVVVGAGSVGIETALFMAERGAKVTVVEIADKLLPTEVITLKPRMIQELKDHKIDVLLEHAVTGFAAPKATIKNMQDQSESAFATDQLVLAVGSRPDKSIQNLLDAHGIAYKDLGDYQGDRVGLIGDAVRSGYFAFKETP